MSERTRGLDEFEMAYELDDIDVDEREKIVKLVKKIPISIQATDDLKLRITAKDSQTYFYKSDKIIDIVPETGNIEAIYHGNPMFGRTSWLDYKFLWSTPDEVVIACNYLNREFHINYSK